MQRIRGVDLRRDVTGLLDAHERQQPALASLVGLARQHLTRVEDIEAEQYQSDKTRALIEEAITETARAFAAETERLVDRVPAPRVEAEDVSDFPSELLHRLSHESTVSGVVMLLRQAEADGQLRSFAPYAIQQLRRLAMDESRQHRAPSPTTAFHALAIWTAKVGVYGRATPDPEVERAHRQRALRERALAIADAIGVRAQVEQAWRRARVPEPSTPTSGGGSGLVFGKYFEQQ